MNTLLRCIFALLILATVFGCHTTDKPVELPDGEKGYSLSCRDTGWDGCYSKASEQCGSGYEIVSRTTEEMDNPQANFGGAKFPRAERILVVKCI